METEKVIYGTIWDLWKAQTITPQDRSKRAEILNLTDWVV